MIKKSFVICAGLFLSACAGGHYYRASDNQRADAAPDILAKFQLDKVACEGEAAKARMASGAGFLVQQVESETVMRGCMAQRGYIVR